MRDVSERFRRGVLRGMALFVLATTVQGQVVAGSSLRQARALVEAGRFPQAEGLLREYVGAHADAAEESFLLAHVLMREGRAAPSLAQYTAAAKLRSPTAEDLKDVALDYALLGDYADAEVWIGRALEQNKGDAEIGYVAGRIAYERHVYPLALQRFQSARLLRPKSSKIVTNAGLAYEAMGEASLAVETYRTAVNLAAAETPVNPQAYLNLALALLHKGNTAESQELLQRAEKIQPNDGQVQKYLGQAYLASSNKEGAQEHLEKAVELLPKDAAAHFLLAKAYQMNGLQEQSRAEFAHTAALEKATHGAAAKDLSGP